MADPDDPTDGNADLHASLVAAITNDYSKLGARIGRVEHEIQCPCGLTTLRVHYPSLRDGQPTVDDLITTCMGYLIQFTLPKSQIDALEKSYGIESAEEHRRKCNAMYREAIRLFIKAHKSTNRNGELGELLLYLLTEWVLGAPQLMTKMPLKTNPNMPVHGSDGIHIKFCGDTKRLLFFWGEAKLYGDVSAAIDSAIKSIAEALTPEKLTHEFSLVNANISFSGLDDIAKTAILSYLDPMDNKSNERANVITCLIGFDFEKYASLRGLSPSKVLPGFEAHVTELLPILAQKWADKLQAAGLEHQTVEIFFFPVPSVQALRDAFQAEIGWAHD